MHAGQTSTSTFDRHDEQPISSWSDRAAATAVETMYYSGDPQACRTAPEEWQHRQDAVGTVRR